MRHAKVDPDEVDALRNEGRHLRRRHDMALAVVDAALVAHGATRHPLVDVLLDVRTLLNPKP